MGQSRFLAFVQAWSRKFLLHREHLGLLMAGSTLRQTKLHTADFADNADGKAVLLTMETSGS